MILVSLPEIVAVERNIEHRHRRPAAGQRLNGRAEPLRQRNSLLIKSDQGEIFLAGGTAVLDDGRRHPVDRRGRLRGRVKAFLERHELLRARMKFYFTQYTAVLPLSQHSVRKKYPVFEIPGNRPFSGRRNFFSKIFEMPIDICIALWYNKSITCSKVLYQKITQPDTESRE